MFHAVAFPCIHVTSMARRPRQPTKSNSKTKQKHSSVSLGFGCQKKELLWWCVESCGACCKLHKGSPTLLILRSMIGPDGWCIHYDKSTRKCSIYSDSPYFCRVEPDVFQSLYGIPKKKFNQKACSSCRDTIKAIYGSNSDELHNFNRSIRSSSSTT